MPLAFCYAACESESVEFVNSGRTERVHEQRSEKENYPLAAWQAR